MITGIYSGTLGRDWDPQAKNKYLAEQTPVGYQTPQNEFLWGIRRRRTYSCGVLDSKGLIPVGYQTPLNLFLWGIRLRRTYSWGVSDSAELIPVGYQTPQN
jgi:hypothetical protein